MLWKHNYSCMLGWILQTRERALFYDSHAGYHAAHCFLFSLHRVALLRMDGKRTTFHFRLVYCSTHVWWSKIVFTRTKGSHCSVISASAVLSNVLTLSLGDITVIGRVKKHVLVLAPRFARWYWLSCWPVSCWLEGNKTPPLSSDVLLIHSKFFFLVLKNNSCFMIHTLWLMTRFLLGSAVCFQMK